MQTPLQRIVRLTLPLLAIPCLVAIVGTQGRGGAGGQREPMVNASGNPLLSAFRFRSIGPASMGGRIDDIAVSDSDPNIIYIGYAVGGVFKSVNNGTSFEPVFEKYSTASIGDIAIHPTNPNIVYVGTGEPNNRQTTSFGDGIYKTTDGGKTFTNVGLKETQSIARIVIDPKNPETVYVASPGHLFGPNPERGLFKTTDGGKTWSTIKFIDDDTGFTDLALDPSNSNTIYAASYQRRRSGCCFNGGGPGGALWKSTDAGKSWTKITVNGLPPGTYGRIALDVSRSNPNVVYVQIEAGEVGAPVRTAEPSASTEATPSGASAVGQVPGPAGPGGGGGRGGFDWCNNGGPARGFGGRGGGGGGAGAGAPEAGAPAPPTTPPPALDPKRSGILRSDNKGGTWTLVSNCNARPMYFSQLRVDPSNDKTIYVAGLPVAKSLDAGHTFATLDDAGGHHGPGHVDQHAIWIDPKNPKHLMIGNDGGLDISWDQGHTWDYVNTMATGLAYWVTADMRRPYNVYTGLQDNGSWGGPSATRGRGGIYNSEWYGIGGGDGFQTAVDPTDYHIVYSESQDGNTNRYDLRTGRSQNIRPRGAAGRGGRAGGGAPAAGAPPATTAAGGGGRGGRGGGRGGRGAGGGGAAAAAEGQANPPAVQVGGQAGQAAANQGPPNVLNAASTDQYRFNWNTPFMLSPHNPSIVWLGGNRLFKSYNRGDTWIASADLTKQIDRNTVALMGVPGNRTQLSKNDGVVSYSTIVSVSESPVLPGVVWAGTDDGNLQVSRDGGVTFTEVGKNLPGLPVNHVYWISRVEASHADAGTAYVSVDGHRNDDLKPYVFVTRDFGKTFESLSNNLPSFGNVQVIREDPKNKDLLYVGTEFGLYISLDGGKQWEKFMNNYPTVRTDDIVVHPRDGDLIVASHGRSIWIADDITPLQQFTPAVRNEDAVLFDIRPVVAYLNDQQAGQHNGGQKLFVGENAPRGALINYYVKGGSAGSDVKITIADASGKVIRNMDGANGAGINRVVWNLTPNQQGGQQGGGVGRGGGRGGGGGVAPGTYTVKLSVGGKDYTKSLVVLEDRWLSER